MIDVVFWSGLRNIDTFTVLSLTWTDLVTHFANSTVSVHAKEAAPGFSPYLIGPPPAPCYRHMDGLPRTAPHRCDRCVKSMSLLVFDVDKCTADAAAECDALLESEGYARLWYSTFSHGQKPDQVALRLVLPLAFPISVDSYKLVRLTAIDLLKIPADPAQCSGKSHFYFMPSRPAYAPHLLGVFEATEGKLLDPSVWLAQPHSLQPYEPPAYDIVGAYEPPRSDPTAPLTLQEERRAEHRAQLEARYARLLKIPKDRLKAELLRRCLDGKPLAQHGARTTSALVVTGILAYAVPHATLDELLEMVRPSLDAMASDGSKLTPEKLERMLVTAMAAKHASEVADELAAKEASEAYRKMLNRIPEG